MIETHTGSAPWQNGDNRRKSISLKTDQQKFSNMNNRKKKRRRKPQGSVGQRKWSNIDVSRGPKEEIKDFSA